MQDYFELMKKKLFFIFRGRFPLYCTTTYYTQLANQWKQYENNPWDSSKLEILVQTITPLLDTMDQEELFFRMASKDLLLEELLERVPRIKTKEEAYEDYLHFAHEFHGTPISREEFVNYEPLLFYCSK